MANTFLYAQGWEVGASYCEKELADDGARHHGRAAGRKHCELLLPIDIVVAEQAQPAQPPACAAWARSTTTSGSSTPARRRSSGCATRWTPPRP